MLLRLLTSTEPYHIIASKKKSGESGEGEGEGGRETININNHNFYTIS